MLEEVLNGDLPNIWLENNVWMPPILLFLQQGMHRRKETAAKLLTAPHCNTATATNIYYIYNLWDVKYFFISRYIYQNNF